MWYVNVSDLKAERFLLQGRIKMKKYEGRFAYPSDPTIPTPPEKPAFLLCSGVLKGCRVQYQYMPQARTDCGN